MAQLAGVATVNMADSSFNAGELTAVGYSDVSVLPLILDLDSLRSELDQRTLKRFSDGRTTFLFVGRCVPNKAIEDLISAFAVYHKCINRNSRLIHVGSFAGSEQYYYPLLAQARELGIDAIHFAGSVPQPQLNSFYQCADLFLCMSRHEGFCVPLLEAMTHDLPILAYAAGAVPETLDGAGVLFHTTQFEPIAEMMDRLTSDSNLKKAVVATQRKRLTRYTSRDLESELKEHLAPILPGT